MMQLRSLLLVALFLIGPALSASAQGKRPGGGGGGGDDGGGGTIACPTDRLSFSPATSAAFQTALDCANPGATITLHSDEAAIYEGNFTLRYQTPEYEADGAPKRITIQSDGVADNLLADNRVSPYQQANLAWLKVPSGSTAPVLTTELKTLPDGTARAASHYQFIGIKFYTNQWVSRLVVLGTGTEKTAEELPRDFVFDRSFFAGSSGEGTKQGLVANGANIEIKNSYFKDFKDTANDAQAIIVWNGAGPFWIKNNYLEGSGENVMFGGGDPSVSGLIPSDITIAGNYFYKPIGWAWETSTQSGTALGKKWRIKNLFELKNAYNVTVEGNVFENNWIQADQRGFAIVFTPRNQSGGCKWCKVENIIFQNNLIRNSVAGFNLLDRDDTNASGQLKTVNILNNLLVNINPIPFEGIITDSSITAAGRLFQILSTNTRRLYRTPAGPVDLTAANNTAFQSREISFSATLPSNDRNNAG